MPRFNDDGRTAKFMGRGGGGGGGGGSRKFSSNHHDERVERNPFKVDHRSRAIQRKQRPTAFSRLDDAGDVVMDPNEPGTSRGGGHVQFQKGFNKREKKQWRKDKKQANNNRDSHVFGPNWHKVAILNGTAFEKTFILQALGNMCRTPFVPVAYGTYGPNTAFFVEDRIQAEALAECNGKITNNEGTKVFFRVLSQPAAPQTAHIDEQCENKIKAVLERRYNPTMQTLNLENFWLSPEFVTEYFLPMYRGSVAQRLSKVVEPLYNVLVGLDLSNNKLTGLENLHQMIKKCTALKALNLRGNKLRETHSLDRLHGLSIVELILEGNPLCDDARDKDVYISAVKKRFPKLLKLDGNDMTPSISFDVTEPSKMPDVRGSCYCNEEAKKVVLRFWELFVTIYDSDNRQPLLDAYHDLASMSMMCSYVAQGGHVSQVDQSKRLSSYLGESRNLIRTTDRTKRLKLLHSGKVDVVSLLNKLPKTTHDLNSFLIDMPVAVENFILFTVTGIFKEREERNQPIRYFCRTFTLVPQNSGFVIINEMLCVTNPTSEQTKAAFQIPAPTPSPSPVPHVQAIPSTSAPAVSLSEADKMQMLLAFIQQSGMNDQWARKCLEENGWDFQKSGVIFLQLKEQNKIPPEAFVK